MLVAKGDGDAAGDMLAAVMAEKELVNWQVELVYAEALAKKNRAGLKEKEKQQLTAEATAALERAKAGGAPLEQVARVAVLVDEKLLEKLELPDPPDPEGKKDERKPRRGRRGR